MTETIINKRFCYLKFKTSNSILSIYNFVSWISFFQKAPSIMYKKTMKLYNEFNNALLIQGRSALIKIWSTDQVNLLVLYLEKGNLASATGLNIKRKWTNLVPSQLRFPGQWISTNHLGQSYQTVLCVGKPQIINLHLKSYVNVLIA